MKMILIIIVLIFVVIFIIFCHSFGNWLVIKDPLKKVDTIIVISGGKGERIRHGIKLFNNNYANYMIISGCSGTETLSCALPMQDLAISSGIPKENIMLDVLKDHSAGTGTQAINTKRIMLKNDFKSAILVTSNFHTRRSKLIFERAFKENNLKLLITYPDKNEFCPQGWWKRKKDRRIVISESLKLVWYWFSFSVNDT